MNNKRYWLYFVWSLCICCLIFMALTHFTQARANSTLRPNTLQWERINYPATHIGTIWIDPNNPQLIYAEDDEGHTGDRLRQSTDGGKTWKIFFDNSLSGSAVAPSNPKIAYVLGINWNLFKTINDGASWLEIRLPVGLSYRAVAINPTDPQIAYISAGAFSTGTPGLYKTTNGGATWDLTLNGNSLTTATVDPINTNIIFVGSEDYVREVPKITSVGGIFKSTDSGINWTRVITRSRINDIVVDRTNTQRVYATTESGILKSIDGGTSWVEINNGLTHRIVRTLVIDPTNSDILYAGTWEGGVFRTLDAGANWVAVNNGIIHTYILSLAVHPTDPLILYAGTEGGGLYKTTSPNSVTPTITPTTTATATSTTRPTSTATNTATPPPGSTFTPTATPTIPPSGVGDAYEEDDTCQQARAVLTTGTLQEHTFHTTSDADWVRFDTTAGLTYRIEVQLPARSRADVDLALYAQCDAAPRQTWQKPFTPGVRLDFPATTAGPIYLQLTNAQAEVAGADVTYTLSVRPLVQQGPENALIVVAGRYKVPDALQANIHHVTNAVYKVFQGKGYTDDRIYYLATDANLPGYDALATEANLQQAITTWAKGRVGTAGVLTLYLMDHGDSGSFYLDEPNQQRLTPGELDGWLTTLEQAVPGVKINVIIEACYAGSFIKNAQSLSKPGRQRVIITSTDSGSLAYASQTGAHFSDHFLVALRQGRHLFGSFWEARAVVNEGLTFQTPWLDGNGDGTPNQIEDAAVAIERGFTAGTLDTEEWPPFIVTAQITATASPERRIIQAEVRDNQEVTTVWAVIYPPSYQPPTDSFELVPEILPTVLLLPQGNDRYAAEYPGFTEVGIYRIVLHAKDEANLEARPFLLTNRLLFLPMISR